MDIISFEIPAYLIQSQALWWFGYNADFVLTEEICQWLEEQNIPIQVAVLKPRKTMEPCDTNIRYEITFDDITTATLFKLRWF